MIAVQKANPIKCRYLSKKSSTHTGSIWEQNWQLLNLFVLFIHIILKCLYCTWFQYCAWLSINISSLGIPTLTFWWLFSTANHQTSLKIHTSCSASSWECILIYCMTMSPGPEATPPWLSFALCSALPFHWRWHAYSRVVHANKKNKMFQRDMVARAFERRSGGRALAPKTKWPGIEFFHCLNAKGHPPPLYPDVN